MTDQGTSNSARLQPERQENEPPNKLLGRPKSATILPWGPITRTHHPVAMNPTKMRPKLHQQHQRARSRSRVDVRSSRQVYASNASSIGHGSIGRTGEGKGSLRGGKNDQKGPVECAVWLTSAFMGMELYVAGSDSVSGQRRSEASDVRLCPRRKAAIFPPGNV